MLLKSCCCWTLSMFLMTMVIHDKPMVDSNETVIYRFRFHMYHAQSIIYDLRNINFCEVIKSILLSPLHFWQNANIILAMPWLLALVYERQIIVFFITNPNCFHHFSFRGDIKCETTTKKLNEYVIWILATTEQCTTKLYTYVGNRLYLSYDVAG